MKQNTDLKLIILSCYINANVSPHAIMNLSVACCEKTLSKLFEEASVSIFVQISVSEYWHDSKWWPIPEKKQAARISNKLQYWRFCHFCLEPLLSNWCCAGFKSHSAAAHFSQENTNAFFFSFTMLLGAMLSNVCAKVFLIPLSLSLRHDVSLICVKCGRKKNLKKKSTWREEKKSFRKYATEAFN